VCGDAAAYRHCCTGGVDQRWDDQQSVLPSGVSVSAAESQACSNQILDLSDDDLQQRAEVDRRVVDPPIQVHTATWPLAGQLDWWVKERQQWLGRVRGADGKQRWIRAVDLRPAAN
jgi:hypothetical protein